MAVVLFMGSSVNLNASDLNLSEDNSGCYEYADKWATIVGFWNQLSHYDEYRVFSKLYDDCVNQ